MLLVEFNGMVTIGASHGLLVTRTENSWATEPFVTTFEATAVTLNTPKKLKSKREKK